MNENTSNDSFDRHEERRQRREERRAARSGSEWIIGIVLVAMGLLLFAQNMQIVVFQNWWALFILIPALGSFGTAWGLARADGGHFNRRARSAAIVGLGLTLVTVMFLFNLNWTIFGPALLLLAGVGILINGLLPE
jgi:cation transport ATPase